MELPTDALRLYLASECGADGYPAEWHASIKHAVREAAGHRCERCGHPYPPGIAQDHPRGEWTPCDERCTHAGPVRLLNNGAAFRLLQEVPSGFTSDDLARIHECSVEAAWRILTVHHLDMDKANCRWWNLAALCQKCHLQIQNKVKLHQVYPWPHSEWFQPFAAGYYALSYLGEELSREETMARLDELLALELVS